MKKSGPILLAAIFFSLCLPTLQPITPKGALIGGLATGITAGTLTGWLTSAILPDHSNPLIPLAVGGIIGGLSGAGMYNALYRRTPDARFAFASQVAQNLSRSKLARVRFDTLNELCSNTCGSFDKRWPVAAGFETCEHYLQNLKTAALHLELAIPEAKSSQFLENINNLFKAIQNLSEVIEHNIALFQSHPKFELQLIALENHHHNQDAEKRHQETQTKLNRLQVGQFLFR